MQMSLFAKKHKDMMKTLNAVKTQWGKVWAAWEAKNQLLELIWGILNADDKENKNESGLHCKADGQSGAAKQLCDLLTKLRKKSVDEKGKLNSEKDTINEYITNVTEYKCDCTFDDWDDDFGVCAGPKVQRPIDIYESCENAETMKEAEGISNCKPTKSACGEGTHSRTRTRRWDAKDGGKGETGQQCKVGTFRDGDYSEVDQSDKQTHTADCKAGKHGGEFCFRDEKGHYNTHEKPCSFEITAALAQNKLAHEKDKYESLVGVLKEEMCKDLKGPCGDNGKCNVEINDDGKLTSWCKCNEGYKGNWCEQAPEKKEEKKTKWLKSNNYFVCGQVLGSIIPNVTTPEACQAKCLSMGGNTITYNPRVFKCQCRSCPRGAIPTKTDNDWEGYKIVE